MTREEAIEVYNGLINKKIREAFEYFVPELRESEDERIRKDIVAHYKLMKEKALLDNQEGTAEIVRVCDDALAWLEKQKEQKQTDLPAGFYFIDLDGKKYYSKEFRYGDMKVKVNDQKPTDYWSVMDDIALDGNIKQKPVEREEDNETDIQKAFREGKNAGREEVLNHPEEYGLQELVAWSKEDCKPFNDALSGLKYAYEDLTNQKSFDSANDIKEAFDWMQARLKYLCPVKQEWSESDGEDERIKKDIVASVEMRGDLTQGRKSEIYAYLEKQKEPKDPFDDEQFRKGYETGYEDAARVNFKRNERFDECLAKCDPKVRKEVSDNIDKMLEQKPYGQRDECKDCQANYAGTCKGSCEMKRKEQKPAEWSEQDEKMFCNLIGIMEGKTGVIPGGWKKYVDWMKNRYKYAFPMPHWKPSSQEFGALRTAVSVLTEERSFPKAAAHIQNIIDVFDGKELRKNWKPSEEQMNILAEVINNVKQGIRPFASEIDHLESLYEQLKAL